PAGAAVEAACDRVGTLAVEAHPVEDQPRLRDPEEPWSLVAGLGSRGDGADLCEAETEPAPELQVRRVLVHPRGEAERRRKADPEDVAREPAGQRRSRQKPAERES